MPRSPCSAEPPPEHEDDDDAGGDEDDDPFAAMEAAMGAAQEGRGRSHAGFRRTPGCHSEPFLDVLMF